MREAMQSLSSQRIALDSDDFIDDAIHADKRQQSAAAGEAVLLLLVGCGQASSCCCMLARPCRSCAICKLRS